VVHLDVVELQDVDVVGLEPLETSVHSEPHVIGAEILRKLALPTARMLRGFVVDVVADLRAVHDFIAATAKRLSELPLTPAVAIAVGGVEERNAVLVVRAPQKCHGLVVGLLSPPTCGDCPCSEAHFAD